MDAGTLGFGLVVEMQNGTPAAVRVASTCHSIIFQVDFIVPVHNMCF